MLKDYLFYYEDEIDEAGEGCIFFVETEEDIDAAIQIALDNMQPTELFLLECRGAFTPDQAEMLGYDTY